MNSEAQGTYQASDGHKPVSVIAYSTKKDYTVGSL